MAALVSGKYTNGDDWSEVPLKVTSGGTLEVSATISSTSLPTGAATSANQTTELTRVGDLTESAPGTDTASSGLNGRLQRIAQRLTSLIALLPTALSNGSLKVSVQEDAVNNGYAHVSSNTTTTIKSGSGILSTVCLNKAGITNTATLYDNTAGSGTVIAVIDTTLTVGTRAYDAVFSTGLTVVTSGGTAADLTLSYR